MAVPRLGIELELQWPAYATALATTDQSHIYDLHYSLQQHRNLNPMSKVRDQTHNLVELVGSVTTYC